MTGDDDPFEEIAEFYEPTVDTRLRARAAIADLRDFESFNAMPEAGGLDDQPSEWLMGMRVCMAAQSHVKAINEAKGQYNRAVDSGADEELMVEIWNEYERIQEEHDSVVRSLRKQWRRGKRRKRR